MVLRSSKPHGAAVRRRRTVPVLLAVHVYVAAIAPGALGWQVSTPISVGVPASVRSPGRLACRGVTCPRAALQLRRRRAGDGAVLMVSASSAESEATTSVDGFDRKAWLKGWDSAKEELDATAVPAHCITGTIPSDLVGTFYRNGPALFELGETKLAHPLDGDGMVAAWTFGGDGTCTFRNRFVRTEAHVKEQNAVQKGYKGRPLRRRSFPGARESPRTAPTQELCTGATGCLRSTRPRCPLS